LKQLIIFLEIEQARKLWIRFEKNGIISEDLIEEKCLKVNYKAVKHMAEIVGKYDVLKENDEN
jgi:hypothetical protein